MQRLPPFPSQPFDHRVGRRNRQWNEHQHAGKADGYVGPFNDIFDDCFEVKELV